MTSTIITFMIVGISLMAFSYAPWFYSLYKLRRRGIIKKKAKPTMFDVKKFLLEGDKETATDLYILIFKGTRKDAQKNIEELSKHIHQKNKI